MSKLTYIIPNLSTFKTVDEVINVRPSSFDRRANENMLFKFIDFYNGSNRFWILGEPGCGKSTLLKTIISEAAINNKKAIAVSLNKIDNSNIEQYLKKVTSIKNEATIGSLFKTADFKLLNQSDTIVCLDALDEVPENDFTSVINDIEIFAKKYNEVSIYISCRIHYVKKSLRRFDRLTDFKYVLINSFDSSQIKKYLLANIPNRANKEELVRALMRKSETSRGHDILGVPRYLEVQVSILLDSNKTEEEIINMKRIDFFEQFVYNKLETEIAKSRNSGNVKIKENEKIITKRVLEKLALIMEIYQTNQITRDELVTFLDDTTSNVNLIFLNICDIDIFIDRVLKHFGDIIEFDNTEFQEYLAAKELLRLGQKSQILYDLIVEPQLKHIYKNWYDVLRYVIEIDSNQIMPLIDFISQKGEFIVEDDFFTLLSSVDEAILSTDDKVKVFNTIYSYKQKTHFYMWPENAARLSAFYQPENYKLFSQVVNISEKDDERRLSNQLLVIGYLIKYNKLEHGQVKYWENVLKKCAINYDYPKIQTRSLNALKYLNSIQVFKDLNCVFITSTNNDVVNNYVRCCYEINPNSFYSIDVLCDGIKRKNEQCRIGIGRISEVCHMEYLLDKFISDTDLLHFYASKDIGFSILEEFHSFSLRLDNLWNDQLSDKLRKILHILISDSPTRDLYNAFMFIEDIIILLDKHIPDYIFEIVNLVLPEDRIYGFEKIIWEIIKVSDVEKFIADSSLLKNGNYIIGMTFSGIRFSNNTEKNLIYDEGRKFIPDMYDKWEKQKTKEEIEIENQNRIYAAFQKELGLGKKNYYLSVFKTFKDNQAVIERLATDKEKKEFKRLLLQAFQSSNPKESVIKVTDTSNDTRSITSSYYIGEYADYIKIAIALGLEDELKQYRKKIIQVIPIINDYSDVGFVLNYLGLLTSDDMNDLFDVCLNRSDDFLIKSPSNLIEAVKIINDPRYLPLLKEFISNNRLRLYEKEKAIECIGELFPEQDYLQMIFDKYINDPDTNYRLLSEIANKYLVSSFRDPLAIEWRLSEIERRLKPLKREYRQGMNRYSDIEREMDRPIFLQCVINLSDPSLINKFHHLLDFSFRIRYNEEYIEYSNYIQNNVYLYFQALKAKGTYSYLKELKDFVKDGIETKNFKFHLKNLEIEYIELLNKPKSIADCIRMYNELKLKQYQNIVSCQDLFYVIEEVIEDIKTFIQKEGFYRPMKSLSSSKVGKATHVSEDIIQKTIKIQIENGLLKRGFRQSDIYREVQLYDDKRLDLLISYGFVGPVMIEIKLLHNPEITDSAKMKEYKGKLFQYMLGSHSEYGFYLVFDVKDEGKHKLAFDDLVVEYKDIRNLQTQLIDCTQ